MRLKWMKIQSARADVIVKRGEEENSTDRRRCRERAVAGRLLRELFGTGLGALCEERAVAPAITVREAECVYAH